MTEQDLIDLKFKKVDVLNEESQNGYDYHYYILDLMPGLSLISSDSVDSKDNWRVYNFDWHNNLELTKASILHLKKIASGRESQSQ